MLDAPAAMDPLENPAEGQTKPEEVPAVGDAPKPADVATPQVVAAAA